SNIEIYKTEDGKTEIEVNLEKETVWLSQAQIMELFEQTKQNISLHINNCYKEKELDRLATVKEYLTVRQEGGREVKRKIKLYNLDVIISVGYRVKSKRGTQFRIWANNVVKDYLVQGYAINQKRLQQKEQEIKLLRSGIQIVSRAIEERANQKGFEYLAQFSKGLELLDDYDHETLDIEGLTTKAVVYPKRQEYQKLINQMKAKFDSDIFGFEKDGSFKSAVAQISKGFGERNQFIYLIIKPKSPPPAPPMEGSKLCQQIRLQNHAFTDGNKRIAAACFLMFLQQNGILTDELARPIISNEALASLTLFIASSKPEEMEIVKRLTISILNRNKT
ncbi:unnamed protein product, partial [Ectocarpus sp. 12 AP-2014]